MNRARALLAAIALATGAALLAVPARAIDPITWYSLDGGGVTFASAGPWRLGATIGQPDAGSHSGGAFTLRGGFWTGGSLAPLAVGDDAPEVLSFRLFPLRPNPVRAGARLAFDLPRAARVTLAVFDLHGRQVQRSEFGLLPAGHREQPWNAEDDESRPLPSGMYFLRLDAGRDRGTHRAIVLR